MIAYYVIRITNRFDMTYKTGAKEGVREMSNFLYRPFDRQYICLCFIYFICWDGIVAYCAIRVQGADKIVRVGSAMPRQRNCGVVCDKNPKKHATDLWWKNNSYITIRGISGQTMVMHSVYPILNTIRYSYEISRTGEAKYARMKNL